MENVLKGNWNAAVKVNAKVTGLGGIIRDSDGEILVFHFCKLTHAY